MVLINITERKVLGYRVKVCVCGALFPKQNNEVSWPKSWDSFQKPEGVAAQLLLRSL